MAAIEATYESRCGICDGRIHEGDPIVRIEDEWVHEECAEAEA